jgi:hypothetical protein
MTTDIPGSGQAAASGRRTIATYTTYRDAERAVDYLADNKFPVDHVSIVGRDLRLVEHVTGRLGWGRAALNGAISGAIVGLLIGWLFAIFDWFSPTIARGWLIVDGLWFGAVVGATMGIVTYALMRGRRDFASVGAMEASSYDIVVDGEVADRAIQMLRQMGSTAAPAAQTTPASSATASPQGRT